MVRLIENAEFEPMNQFHKTSPESIFTRREICSRATPLGRISLEEQNLILTERGKRLVHPLNWRNITGS